MMQSYDNYENILKGLVCSQRSEKNIKQHYPDLWKYIVEMYSADQVGEELSWSEKLYWFENYLKSHPVCRTCGKSVSFKASITGYPKYCSSKCCNNSKDRIDKIKQTNLERYGVESYTQTEEHKHRVKQTNLERYGVEHPALSKEIKQKTRQTNLERYGAENPSQVEEFKEKRKQTNLERYGVEYYTQTVEFMQKSKQTNLERYGVEHTMQSDIVKQKVKESNLKKYGVEHTMQLDEFKNKLKKSIGKLYGVEHYSQTDEYKNKCYNTKKKNGTFNSSKIEQELRNWLDINNIEYKYQYRSEQYPFICDFYFPDQDLYLEIQGSWTHGYHPYDPESLEDQDTLTLWTEKGSKYYNVAIETWVIRDPEKRRWAKEYGLNWIEVFSCDLDKVTQIVKESLKIS